MLTIANLPFWELQILEWIHSVKRHLSSSWSCTDIFYLLGYDTVHSGRCVQKTRSNPLPLKGRNKATKMVSCSYQTIRVASRNMLDPSQWKRKTHNNGVFSTKQFRVTQIFRFSVLWMIKIKINDTFISVLYLLVALSLLALFLVRVSSILDRPNM